MTIAQLNAVRSQPQIPIPTSLSWAEKKKKEFEKRPFLDTYLTECTLGLIPFSTRNRENRNSVAVAILLISFG